MATPDDHDPQKEKTAVDLATALVDVGQMVTSGASVVNVFSMLSSQCVELIPVSAAGILLIDSDNSLHVIGSSSHAVTLLDLFQVQNNEGPCHDCCTNQETVFSDNISTDQRWPNFSALALAENFVSVYALPLQAQNIVVGALNLFAQAPLSSNQLATARSLADAATLAFLQADMQQDRLLIARKLRQALEGRNVIEQAKGVLSERHGISMMEAFWSLRDASNQRDLDIVELATSVVNRDIDL